MLWNSTPLDWAHVLVLSMKFVLSMKVLSLQLAEMAGFCIEIGAHLPWGEGLLFTLSIPVCCVGGFYDPSVGLRCQCELFCTRRCHCVLRFLGLGCK